MLADLPEESATGVTAAFFARVRAESGSALINFVWRHLATLPDGTADWCWDVVRNADVTPVAQALSLQADRAAAALAGPSPKLPTLEPQAANILAAYNRNNPMNLARMGLLLSALDSLDNALSAPRSTDAPHSDGPHADAALPPLPPFSALGADDLRAVDAVSWVGPASASGVSPSLWRHLTVQAGLMPAIAAPVAKAVSTAEFRAAHRALGDAASAPLRHFETPVPPPDFDADRVRTSVTSFAQRIAELTLAGRILANWTLPTPQESTYR
ncbi:hypothetical protein A8B78_00260 [Jannaschia sp. EhC01]|nr:hypothetical protein A8B78_00260 [Jannaschia sp. EhC01]